MVLVQLSSIKRIASGEHFVSKKIASNHDIVHAVQENQNEAQFMIEKRFVALFGNLSHTYVYTKKVEWLVHIGKNDLKNSLILSLIHI